MHWIYLIHKFHNLSWITKLNELFHDILIYWDAPVVPAHKTHQKEGTSTNSSRNYEKVPPVWKPHMPPCQWFLRTDSSHPCRLLCFTPIPWQTFAFVSVADESLDDPFGLWDWELDVRFPKNKLKRGLWPQHTFPLSLYLSEMSSGPENQKNQTNETE